MGKLRVRVRFRWYDLWIGAYWDRNWKHLYICPLPCIVIEIWRPRCLVTGLGRGSVLLKRLNDLQAAMTIAQEELGVQILGGEADHE